MIAVSKVTVTLEKSVHESFTFGSYISVQRTLNKTFKHADPWCAYPYRVVWVSRREKTIITYCEGDVTNTKFAKRVDFVNELRRASKFYKENI